MAPRALSWAVLAAACAPSAAFAPSPGCGCAQDVRSRRRWLFANDGCTWLGHRRCLRVRGPKEAALFSSKRAHAPIREEIRYIAGRRALLLRPPPKESEAIARPPLVVLGGMAQSIPSWEFHLPSLARERPVLFYEALGQGPPPPEEVRSGVALENYYDDVSLERQGRDFWRVIDEAFGSDSNEGASQGTRKVDVAGFSFGGRVAMAAASLRPGRIRRLHLTGVGAERDEYAQVILASWREILGATEKECDVPSRDSSRLRSFAWSTILATYSESFLASAGAHRVATWVDGVCNSNNTEQGLRALMKTHEGEEGWTPAAMAERIQSANAVEWCRVAVGSQDKMAHPSQAQRLAKILQTNEDESYIVFEGRGHAVPMEAMRLWREDVLEFLNRS